MKKYTKEFVDTFNSLEKFTTYMAKSKNGNLYHFFFEPDGEFVVQMDSENSRFTKQNQSDYKIVEIKTK